MVLTIISHYAGGRQSGKTKVDPASFSADPSLELLRGVDLILHAGDVGERGGHQGTSFSCRLHMAWDCACDKAVTESVPIRVHAEILALLLKIAPTLCVRGNVDAVAEADEFPAVRVIHLQGWTIVITHIAGDPPSQASKIC